MRAKKLFIATAVGLAVAGTAPAQAGGSHHGGYHGWGHHGGYHRSHGHEGAALGTGLVFGVLLGSALASQDRHERPVYHRRPRPAYYYDPYAGPSYDHGDGAVVYRPLPPRPAPAFIARRPAGPCLQAREYQTHVTINGREVDAYGIACLQPDGSWRQGPPRPVPRF